MHPERGTWHDFEADAGGGTLALIEHVLTTDHGGALAWLVEARLIDPPAGPGRPPAAPPAELATYIGVGVSEVLYERVRRDADISLDMSQAGPE